MVKKVVKGNFYVGGVTTCIFHFIIVPTLRARYNYYAATDISPHVGLYDEVPSFLSLDIRPRDVSLLIITGS
jgi:hypothetical protein